MRCPRATYAFQMGMIHIGPPKVFPRVLIPKNFQKRRLTKIFPYLSQKTFENWCRAELSQWKKSNLETWTSWQLHGTSRRVCGKDHQKKPATDHGNLMECEFLVFFEAKIEVGRTWHQCPRDCAQMSKMTSGPLSAFSKQLELLGASAGIGSCTPWTRCQLVGGKKAFLRSTFFWMRNDNPCATISAVRDELQLIVFGVKSERHKCPCSNNAVQLILGRLKLQNSLDDITWLRGQAYFTASMESRIPQSSKVPRFPSEVECSRLRDLHSQYTFLSECCRARWFCSSWCWARRAGPLWPSFRMINLCLKHCVHFEWCVWKRMRSRCHSAIP